MTHNVCFCNLDHQESAKKNIFMIRGYALEVAQIVPIEKQLSSNYTKKVYIDMLPFGIPISPFFTFIFDGLILPKRAMNLLKVSRRCFGLHDLDL